MKNDHKSYIILFLLSLIWGSSFILIKRGLDVYSDVQVAVLRIFLSSVSLFPFLIYSLRKFSFNYIFPLIIIGIVGNGIPAFLFSIAQTDLNSSFVGILNALTPIFTLIFGLYFFNLKINTKGLLGIIFGFLGVLLLYVNTGNENDNIYIASLYVIIATILYAISINVIRRYLFDLDSIAIATLSFFIIFPFSAFYILMESNFTYDDSLCIYNLVFTNEGFISFIYILVLSVVCTSFPIIFFNRLIKDTSAIFASSVTYIIPVIAVLWGLFDGEHLRSNYYIGILVILFGVYLTSRNRSNS